MRQVILASATLLVLLVPVSAGARPLDQTARFQIARLDLATIASDSAPPDHGVYRASDHPPQDTVYYGGTHWDPADGRWESMNSIDHPGSAVWTFDSGIGSAGFDGAGNPLAGSALAPHVDPFKDSTLHASMEGWIGFDKSLSPITSFRRLDATPFTGPEVCVGATAGLGGDWSYWAGVLPAEADTLCFVVGQGYGDSWFVCTGQEFSYSGGDVTLTFDYNNDTEPEFDFTYVLVDSFPNSLSELNDIEIAKYDGVIAGASESILLREGIELPGDVSGSKGSVLIKFCVKTDGAYSDQDGLYVSSCGAFAVDDIVLAGGIVDSADFETGDDGWSLLPITPGLGGEWSNIVALSDLPAPLTPCVCDLADSVLVFEDLTLNGHGIFQDNLALSPWIDLDDNNDTGPAGKFIEAKLYTDLPIINYLLVQFEIQWFPVICPRTGAGVHSRFTSNGFVFHFSNSPQCTAPTGAPTRIDFNAVSTPGATEMRLAVGVLSFCRFFANCTGITNSTPWFDDVRLGVYGPTEAPILTVNSVDLPQDAFPENGTLNIQATGRLDSNRIRGDTEPEPGTSLGDTLVVRGASGGAEVRVVFAVHPGPGTDTARLNTWLADHPPEAFWLGLPWYSARVDTAENDGRLGDQGTFMTAYHEEDPNFSGSDTDLDPGDPGPLGGVSRLANDVFPDDLFTPGTRVCLFYKARFLTGTTWFVLPETTGGNYFEMEVLPSSMTPDQTFNPVLYVDHVDDPDAQPVIEGALGNVLGAGSANFENTAWDRWDVRGSGTRGGSFGRSIGNQYGATFMQTLGYKIIIWNTGDMDFGGLINEDAIVLNAWLGFGAGPGLYLSGDGLAESITDQAALDPDAFELLSEYVGAELACGTVRDAGCPPGTVVDSVACIDVDPLATGHFLTVHPTRMTGNGCPELRSFDVLGSSPTARSGDARGNLVYNGPAKGIVTYAAISNEDQNGVSYRTVIDGGSVHTLRDLDCQGTQAVEERLQGVLDWLFATPVFTLGVEEEPVSPRWGFRLLSANPVSRYGGARFELTATRRAPATLRVFDVAGRLVRTVFDGDLEPGVHVREWDLLDGAGRKVTGGVYFARVTGEGDASMRVVVLP